MKISSKDLIFNNNDLKKCMKGGGGSLFLSKNIRNRIQNIVFSQQNFTAQKTDNKYKLIKASNSSVYYK